MWSPNDRDDLKSLGGDPLQVRVLPRALAAASSNAREFRLRSEGPASPGSNRIEYRRTVRQRAVEGQLLYAAAVRIHDVNLFVAISGTLKRDVFTIRRPDGIIVLDAVVERELRDTAAICIHGEDVKVAAVAPAAEHNLLSAW